MCSYVFQKRPLYSSAVVKYNISGDINYFRIEEMSAVSEHMFAPFGDQKKGGLALFARQKMSYKGSRADPSIPALKSLRDESAEAKGQSKSSSEEIGVKRAEGESRISHISDSESVKKLRPISEVKKGLSPDKELFMSVPAFEDSHNENPTPEEKRKQIAEVINKQITVLNLKNIFVLL